MREIHRIMTLKPANTLALLVIWRAQINKVRLKSQHTPRVSVAFVHEC